MYVMTDESGRVTAATDREEFAGGMTEADEPESFDWAHFGDWVLKDGELVHDGAQTAAEEAARKEAEAEATRREAIDAGAADFFADGGRERMKAEIDTAKATADEAKGAADTAAASMNEYLDALLGLDATNETGANDAE